MLATSLSLEQALLAIPTDESHILLGDLDARVGSMYVGTAK